MKKLSLQSTHYLYLIQSYREWLQIIGYADPTVSKWPVYVQELLHYLEGRDISSILLVKSQDIGDFFQYLQGRSSQVRPGALSSNHIRSILSAVNSFARYLNSTGKYILDIPSAYLTADTPLQTVLTVAEVMSLYEATFLPHPIGGTAMGQRDRAMIAIFYGCGLRRSEGIYLNCADIDLTKRLLLVRKGKGAKQRYVPIASRHVEDIRAYLEEGREWFQYKHYTRDYTRKFPQKKAVIDQEAFFLGERGTRMQYFYKRLQYLGEKAGILKSFSLHTLRHSIATHLLQGGMNLEDIARFLGHDSLESTQIYTHLVHELKSDT